jgi:hypothetical protein
MNSTIISLDVSDLPAPEPLQKILELLGRSQKNDIICMIHRQNPCALFPILKERGYSSSLVEDKNLVKVYIWHQDNQAAFEIVQGEIKRVR